MKQTMLTLSSAPGDDISRSDVLKLPALVSSLYTGVLSFIFTVSPWIRLFHQEFVFRSFPVFADTVCVAGLF